MSGRAFLGLLFVAVLAGFTLYAYGWIAAALLLLAAAAVWITMLMIVAADT